MTTSAPDIAKVHAIPCDDVQRSYVIESAPWEAEFCLVLESGRKIILSDLYQYRAYCNWLEGIPGPSMNQTIIKEALALAARWKNTANTVSRETPVSYLGADSVPFQVVLPYPSNEIKTSEALPAIITFAAFDSDALSQDSPDPMSSALFVWFQHEWGLPSPLIRDRLAKVDWKAAAREWNW